MCCKLVIVTVMSASGIGQEEEEIFRRKQYLVINEQFCGSMLSIIVTSGIRNEEDEIFRTKHRLLIIEQFCVSKS